MLPLSLASVVAFVGLTMLLVLSPGLATAVVLRNTAEGGRRAGVLTALGIAGGNAFWGLSVGLGLGAVISRTPGAMTALQVGGAVLLTGLGVMSLRRAWAERRAGAVADAALAIRERPTHDTTMLVEGTLTNLMNAPVPIFYVATVPQFIDRGPGFTAAFFTLTAIHVSMAFVCHGAYAVAFGGLARAMAVRGRRWILHAITGAVLVALALMSMRR